ncbi:NAD(P)/FAD-dependent oxidoreductase [Kribbella pittospori]|uniref:NAD(P)/FAD-dependent oxidoreductase n=1 Tax=Kribbella pittospori TaxID=722689 RepID=A0A4R0KWT5_9ACTN|nr:FAD-dependent monooxygenase [Kribbella pittospori]TCC64134.1 NAD(P)/FAD-dependent oxidoreductase [Kribbella pittospori]
MSTTYDILVVGGRVAGASTAMLLARAGARVALVERSAYGSDTVSTHGLMRAGVLQLSRWGLLDTLTAAGTPPIRETTFHYSDREAQQITIRAKGGVGALYAPRRQVLDRILVDAAADAGADVRHRTAVTTLLRDESGRVAGARVQDRAGRTADLLASLTIGADGIRSAVASAVDASVVRRGESRSAILYRYYAGLRTAGYEWAYAPGAGAGFLPTNEELTCVFVATTPARMQALGREEAFATLLTETGLAERVFSAEPASRLHGWAGAAGFIRQSWGPGWALVGDAGYYKDPITTHGMTDGLRDAELLTDAILRSPLAQYQATRDQLSHRFFDATESVASYAWSMDEVRLLLREVSSAMGDEVEHLQSLPSALLQAPGAGL